MAEIMIERPILLHQHDDVLNGDRGAGARACNRLVRRLSGAESARSAIGPGIDRGRAGRPVAHRIIAIEQVHDQGGRETEERPDERVGMRNNLRATSVETLVPTLTIAHRSAVAVPRPSSERFPGGGIAAWCTDPRLAPLQSILMSLVNRIVASPKARMAPFDGRFLRMRREATHRTPAHRTHRANRRSQESRGRAHNPEDCRGARRWNQLCLEPPVRTSEAKMRAASTTVVRAGSQLHIARQSARRPDAVGRGQNR